MTEVLAYTIRDACRVAGIWRTSLYTLIGTGRLKEVKVGGKTLITADALRTFIAHLPPALIRTGGKTAI
jgi:excisionase family DNA binding protein